MYKGYLLKQVEEYLHTHYTLTPKCVVLTAVLHPDRKPAPGETEGEWGGKCEAGKEEGETHYMQDAEPLGDLVAAVEISFAPVSRVADTCALHLPH